MSVHIHLYLSYPQAFSMATGIQNEKFETPQDIESPKKKITYLFPKQEIFLHHTRIIIRIKS